MIVGSVPEYLDWDDWDTDYISDDDSSFYSVEEIDQSNASVSSSAISTVEQNEQETRHSKGADLCHLFMVRIESLKELPLNEEIVQLLLEAAQEFCTEMNKEEHVTTQ